MKLVTYRAATGLRPGVLVDNNVIDIARLSANTGNPSWYTSVRSFLGAGPDALAELTKLLANFGSGAIVGAVSDIVIGPPVPDAGKIVCIGLNYKAHADESNREIPPIPVNLWEVLQFPCRTL